MEKVLLILTELSIDHNYQPWLIECAFIYAGNNLINLSLFLMRYFYCKKKKISFLNFSLNFYLFFENVWKYKNYKRNISLHNVNLKRNEILLYLILFSLNLILYIYNTDICRWRMFWYWRLWATTFCSMFKKKLQFLYRSFLKRRSNGLLFASSMNWYTPSFVEIR